MDLKINIYGGSTQIISDNIVKTIKTESLLKALVSTDIKLETPILPPNTIQYFETGTCIKVILYHPESKFNAIVGNKVYENCCRPALIVRYSLSINEHGDNKIYSILNTECFGITDDLIMINKNTRLLGLPFPNFSSNGWVCWGSNSTSGEIKSLMGLRNYIERAFNSPFNNHLFNSSFLKHFNINNEHDLFASLQNLNSFPNHYLENLGRNFTLGNL